MITAFFIALWFHVLVNLFYNLGDFINCSKDVAK